MPEFEFPRTDQHTVVVGQNGSGKSQVGFWLLSKAPFDRMPWVMFDSKRETMFKRLHRQRLAKRIELKPRLRHLIPYRAAVPTRPGLYWLPFNEGIDDEEIEDFLARCHRKGNIGLYFDEGFAVPGGRSSAVRMLLTQGRSRQTPIIACIQRPVDIDRYFFSEAKHLCILYLVDVEDRRTVRRYAPIDIDQELPPYHFHWFNNGQRHLYTVKPVPNANEIVASIAAKAPPPRWWE